MKFAISIPISSITLPTAITALRSRSPIKFWDGLTQMLPRLLGQWARPILWLTSNKVWCSTTWNLLFSSWSSTSKKLFLRTNRNLLLGSGECAGTTTCTRIISTWFCLMMWLSWSTLHTPNRLHPRSDWRQQMLPVWISQTTDLLRGYRGDLIPSELVTEALVWYQTVLIWAIAAIRWCHSICPMPTTFTPSTTRTQMRATNSSSPSITESTFILPKKTS